MQSDRKNEKDETTITSKSSSPQVRLASYSQERANLFAPKFTPYRRQNSGDE